MAASEQFTPAEEAVLALFSQGPIREIKNETRVQKLAFLLAKSLPNREVDQELEFIPWGFGPYSENLDDIVGQLANDGYISVAEKPSRSYTLTPKGLEAVTEIQKRNPSPFAFSHEIMDTAGQLSQRDLVALVYELYPDFAKESAIREEVAQNKSIDSLHVRVRDLPGDASIELRTKLGHRILAKREKGLIRLNLVD